MNKQGRVHISEWLARLEVLKDLVEAAAADEGEKFENMPSGLQESERGQVIFNNAELLDNAADALNVAINSLEEIQ